MASGEYATGPTIINNVGGCGCNDVEGTGGCTCLPVVDGSGTEYATNEAGNQVIPAGAVSSVTQEVSDGTLVIGQTTDDPPVDILAPAGSTVTTHDDGLGNITIICTPDKNNISGKTEGTVPLDLSGAIDSENPTQAEIDAAIAAAYAANPDVENYTYTSPNGKYWAWDNNNDGTATLVECPSSLVECVQDGDYEYPVFRQKTGDDFMLVPSQETLDVTMGGGPNVILDIPDLSTGDLLLGPVKSDEVDFGSCPRGVNFEFIHSYSTVDADGFFTVRPKIVITTDGSPAGAITLLTGGSDAIIELNNNPVDIPDKEHTDKDTYLVSGVVCYEPFLEVGPIANPIGRLKVNRADACLTYQTFSKWSV